MMWEREGGMRDVGDWSCKSSILLGSDTTH